MRLNGETRMVKTRGATQTLEKVHADKVQRNFALKAAYRPVKLRSMIIRIGQRPAKSCRDALRVEPRGTGRRTNCWNTHDVIRMCMSMHSTVFRDVMKLPADCQASMS